MSFGQGLLQGFQVADGYLNNQQQLAWQQEDRDIASKERARLEKVRGLTELQGAMLDAQGSMSAEEFQNSGGMANFINANKDHPEIQALANQGAENNVRFKGLVSEGGTRNPHATGRYVGLVDVLDDKGNVTKANRPITNNRSSSPTDQVAQITGKDMYDALQNEFYQIPGYQDPRKYAGRVSDQMAALDNVYGGGSAPASTPAGLGAGASTTSTTPTGTTPTGGTGGHTNPNGTVVRPTNDGAADQTTSSVSNEKVASSEERIGQLNKEIETVDRLLEDARLEAAVGIPGLNGSPQASRPTNTESQDTLDSLTRRRAAAKKELEALKPSVATTLGRKAGSAVNTAKVATAIAGNLYSSAREVAWDSITGAASDFVDGFRGIDNQVKPEGVSKPEEFTTGLDNEVKKVVADPTQPVGAGNTRKQTPAKKKKIDSVMQQTANSIGNQQKISRKGMKDFRKALQNSVLHGDITGDQAVNTYYKVLEANKAGGAKYKAIMNDNGILVLNEGDGTFRFTGFDKNNPVTALDLLSPTFATTAKGQKFLANRADATKETLLANGYEVGKGGYAAMQGEIDSLTTLAGVIQPNQIGQSTLVNQAISLKQRFASDGPLWMRKDPSEVPDLSVFYSAVKRGIGDEVQFEKFLNDGIKPISAGWNRNLSKGEAHAVNRLISYAEAAGGNDAAQEMIAALSDPRNAYLLSMPPKDIQEKLLKAEQARQAGAQ